MPVIFFPIVERVPAFLRLQKEGKLPPELSNLLSGKTTEFTGKNS